MDKTKFKSLIYYSDAERIAFISDCLSNDFYYNRSRGSFAKIASAANYVIVNYFIFNLVSPFSNIYNDKIIFLPDHRNIEREDYLTSEAKYAVHFVTGKNQKTGFREFDNSKASNLALINNPLINPDLKLHSVNDYGENTFNFVSKLEANKNAILVGREYEYDATYIRIVAFMPNQRDLTVENKKASALKTEAKPTRTNTPSN